jgi:hypothetical protein
VKRILFSLCLLFILNQLIGQDIAGNKNFIKFLKTGTTVKSFIDNDGNETILAVIYGQIYIDNASLYLNRQSLIMLRHNIKDSLNYSFTFISDTNKVFSYTSISDICKTSLGIGFIINFSSQAISLKYPVYNIPKYLMNSVYLEFDAFLNLRAVTKFGSISSFGITKLCSDSLDNKYAFVNYLRTVNINDSDFLQSTTNFKYGLFCFNSGIVNWTKTFDTVNTKSATGLQLLNKRNDLYFLLYLSGSYISYDGRLLARTAKNSYVLLRLNTMGNYLRSVETDSVDCINIVYHSLFITNSKVFLSLSYCGFLKFGNQIYTRKPLGVASIFSEMDSNLNTINQYSYLSGAGSIINFRTYDESNNILYFNLLRINNGQGMEQLVINDSLRYFSNFYHYPDFANTHYLMGYSTARAALVSSYEITAMINNYNYSVYCPPNNNPKIYCNFIYDRIIKVEGAELYDVYFKRYMFTLDKLVKPVVHPTNFIAKRRQKNITELVWVNQENYDSMEIQKFCIQFAVVDNTFKVKANAVNYIDSSISFDTANYFYKIRGFKNGVYSIWILADSTSLTNPLACGYLSGSTINDSIVSLSWDLKPTPKNNIFFREIYRSEYPKSGFQKITQIIPRTNVNYFDAKVSNSKTYYYFLRDYNYMWECNTDTIKVTWKGVLNFYSNEFEPYPNPCLNLVNFKISDKSGKDINFIDAKGRTILIPFYENGADCSADISVLQSGIYTITYIQFGQLYVKRLVKL